MKINSEEYNIKSLRVVRNKRTGESALTLWIQCETGSERVELGYKDWKFFKDMQMDHHAGMAIGPKTQLPDWWLWIDEIGKQAGYMLRYLEELGEMFPRDMEPHPGPRFNCAGDVVVPKEDQKGEARTVSNYIKHVEERGADNG